MTLTSAIAKNTLVQFIGKTITTLLGIVSLSLMTKYLGQAGFGEYTTIITFLTFFAIIADFGLTLVTSQMISEVDNKEEENTILNNIFTIRLLSIIIFIALAIISVSFFSYSQTIKTGVLIASLAFIFPALNQVLIGLFQKKLDMNKVVIAEVVSKIILITGIIIAITHNFGLQGILIAAVVSAFINFIINYIFSTKFTIIKLAYNFNLWKKIFDKSWPLAITITLNLIYLRADILLLSLFKDNNTVGLYGAAYRIIDVLSTIPFMFAGIILPILTRAWVKKKKNSFNSVLQQSFNFMAIIAIPLVVGTQFLAKPIITLIAGQDFILSSSILKLLIFSVAAIFLGTIFSHAIIALNKQKKMIKFYIITSLSSLLAYLILIPKYSYWGAASVTLYSELIIAVFAIYYTFKVSNFIPSFNIIWKALLSSCLMGLILYIIPMNYKQSLGGLSLTIILAILTYFISLRIFKGIGKKDLAIFINK